MKPYTDYTPCDVFASDYDPFAQRTDYVPDIREYHLCMTEEQYSMLREAAEGKLDIARHELHDIKSSHDIYRLNGCGEEKYAEFFRMAEQKVEEWESIVEELKVDN
jgi:hypothetical protein